MDVLSNVQTLPTTENQAFAKKNEVQDLTDYVNYIKDNVDALGVRVTNLEENVSDLHKRVQKLETDNLPKQDINTTLIKYGIVGAIGIAGLALSGIFSHKPEGKYPETPKPEGLSVGNALGKIAVTAIGGFSGVCVGSAIGDNMPGGEESMKIGEYLGGLIGAVVGGIIAKAVIK